MPSPIHAIRSGSDPSRAPPSARRIAANRRNALRSTGPRSAAGKARSARNAVKHGARAAAVLLPGDDPAEYAAHVRDVLAEHAPADALEAALVRDLADVTWRLRRLAKAEAQAARDAAGRAGDDDGVDPEFVVAWAHAEARLAGRFLAVCRRILRLRRARGRLGRARVAIISGAERSHDDGDGDGDGRLPQERTVGRRGGAAFTTTVEGARREAAKCGRAERSQPDGPKRTGTPRAERTDRPPPGGGPASPPPPSPLFRRAGRAGQRPGTIGAGLALRPVGRHYGPVLGMSRPAVGGLLQARFAGAEQTHAEQTHAERTRAGRAWPGRTRPGIGAGSSVHPSIRIGWATGPPPALDPSAVRIAS